jgi:hypothetical protein
VTVREAYEAFKSAGLATRFCQRNLSHRPAAALRIFPAVSNLARNTKYGSIIGRIELQGLPYRSNVASLTPSKLNGMSTGTLS